MFSSYGGSPRISDVRVIEGDIVGCAVVGELYQGSKVLNDLAPVKDRGRLRNIGFGGSGILTIFKGGYPICENPVVAIKRCI